MPADHLPSSLIVSVKDMAQVQGGLFEEERMLLVGATRARQQEIIAGRVMAHQLMERAGHKSTPVLQDASGAPLWPDRICGSIAHSERVVAVVVATRPEILSVGIDIEDGRDLGSATSQIANNAELCDVIRHPLAGDIASAARLLFSAKEALFKCQAPLTGNMDLAFDQVQLRQNSDGLLLASSVASVDRAQAELIEQMRIIVEEFQSVRLAIAWLKQGEFSV